MAWAGDVSTVRYMPFVSTGFAKGTAITSDANGNVIAAGVLSGQEVQFGSLFMQTPNAFVYREDQDSSPGLFALNQNFAGSSYPMHIAATPSGGFVVSGVFTGTVDFGTGPHTVAPNHGGVFIAQFSVVGGAMWSRGFDGGLTGYPGGLAVDPNTGNVIFAATFEKTVDMGGGPLVSKGAEDILLAQLDPSGKILWQKSFGGTGDTTDWVRDITLDAAGNILLTGLYQSGLNFGGGALPNADVNFRSYIAKLNPQGQQIWSLGCTGTSDMQGGTHIAADTTGAIAVSGWFNGDITCGGLSLKGLSTDNPYVLVLDDLGKPAQMHLITLGGANQEGPDVAFDIQHNLMMAGALSGKLEIPDSNLQALGSTDIFFAKLSPAGQFLAGMRTGDKTAQGALALTSINDGNVALTGFSHGPFCINQFDLPQSSGFGTEEGFVLELLP